MAKLKQCKCCSKEIAQNAKSCPNCGSKNPKPFYKKVWFWIIAIIIIAGVSGSSSDDNSTESNTPDATTTEDSKTNPKIGDVVTQNNISMTVLGVRELEPGMFTTLEDGQHLYAIEFEIDNTANSKSVASSTMLCYNLLDSNDYKGALEIATEGTKGSLDGEVPAGGKLKGEIVFKLNDNSTPKTLTVGLDLLKNDVVFDLQK